MYEIEVANFAGASGTSVIEISTIVLSIVTFLWAVFWSIWIYKKQKLNEYWFKTIVGPKTIDPLLNFYSDWYTKLNDESRFSDINAAADLNASFGKEKDRLINKLWLSRLLFDDLPSTVSSELDSVEDLIANGIGQMSRHSADEINEFKECSFVLQKAVLKILSRLGSTEPKLSKIQ